MTIKHLVLSGGGPTGFVTYGVIKQLWIKKFWKLSNIQSIYGCSIGALVGAILALKYQWEWLDDFFMKRPWYKLFEIQPEAVFNIFDKQGLIDDFVEKVMEPMLTAKGLTVQSTMKDLYEYSKIDLHVFTTDINTSIPTKIDISAKTHPNLSIVKAIAMSCSLPILFKPIYFEGRCCIDGGLVNNFPLNDCLDTQKCDPNEVLAIKNIWCQPDITSNPSSSIFEYLFVIIKRLQLALDSTEKQRTIKNTVRCLINNLNSFDEWQYPFKHEKGRIQLMEQGMQHADIFESYLNSD